MGRKAKINVDVEIKDTVSLLKNGVSADKFISMTYKAMFLDGDHYRDHLYKQIENTLSDEELESNISSAFDEMLLEDLQQFMTVINGDVGYNAYETAKWSAKGIVYTVPVEFDVDQFVQTVKNNNFKKPELHIVKSMILSSSEFDKIVKSISDNIKPNYAYDGLSWDYDEDKLDPMINPDDVDGYMKSELSIHFGLHISSIHLDYSSEDTLLVWITFAE